MTKLKTIAVAAAALAVPLTVFAADHGDISAGGMEPTADLTDLYAWMSDDTSMLNLVMAVNGNAGASDTFSDALAYVFHVDSTAGLGQAQTDTPVMCKFASATFVECWAGTDYAAGDPSDDQNPLMSEGGSFKVFAGLRNDPFFLEYQGFLATEAAAVGEVVADNVDFDNDGCAVLSPGQSDLLVTQLRTGPDGVAPTNTFAGQNVLALVVQIDKTMVNSGGPILGIWAETSGIQ